MPNKSCPYISAAAYLMYRCKNGTVILDSPDDCVLLTQDDLLEGNFSSPKDPFQTERFVLKVEDALVDTVQTYVLQVIDAHDLSSPTTSITGGVFSPEVIRATNLFLAQKTVTTDITPEDQTTPTTAEQTTTVSEVVSQPPDDAEWSTSVIVTVSTIIFLLLVIFITMIAICIKLYGMSNCASKPTSEAVPEAQTVQVEEERIDLSVTQPVTPAVTVNIGCGDRADIGYAPPDHHAPLPPLPQQRYYIPRAKRSLSSLSSSGGHVYGNPDGAPLTYPARPAPTEINVGVHHGVYHVPYAYQEEGVRPPPSYYIDYSLDNYGYQK